MTQTLNLDVCHVTLFYNCNVNSFAILSFCFCSSCPNYKYVNQDANVEFKDSLGRLDFDSGENYSNISLSPVYFTHPAISLQAILGKLMLHKYQGQLILHNYTFLPKRVIFLYSC